MERLGRFFKGIGVGRIVGLAMLAGFVLLRVWDPVPLEVLRLKTFDFYQVIKPREVTPVPVAIIDIDEESLSAVGQWPWSRTKLGELVNRVSALGGVVMGFDIIFAEKDRLSPNALVEHYPDLDPVTQRRLANLPANDEIFAHAMQRFRVVTALSGYHRELEHSSETPLPTPPQGSVGGDPTPYLHGYPGVVRNIETIEAAAMGQGVITIKPEPDGIVRRVPTALNVQGAILPSLSIEMLRIATGGAPFIVKSNEVGITSIVVGGVEVPTDQNGRMWVHFAPHDRARYISAKDILDGTVDPQRIAGHLLLVGTSAVGLHDIKATPIDPVMPGVEVHAQVLEMILSQVSLSRPGYAVGAEVLMAIAVGLIIIVILPIFRAWVVLTLGALTALILGQLSWHFFSKQGVLVDVAYPLVSSLAIYGAMVFINYFREEVEKRKIRSAFGQYISPDLVDQLAENPSQLVLGGETRTMSILFSDVRGFTAISEQFKTDPQGLTTLMNRLLTPLSHAIIDNGGTIDKYMGDAVMAFWNAPLETVEHANQACEASLVMLEGLRDLNEARRQEARDASQEFLALNAGIGINTGECVVGNMGSDMRFDYSVLGDAVNLASRLEGQSKTYGVDVVLGEETAQLVDERYRTLELDLIRVKGKQEPERIFALLGRRADMDPDRASAVKKEVDALIAAYREKDWAAAEAAIDRCRNMDEARGLDGLMDLYASRVAEFREAPPPKDWDGVFVATSK